MKPNLSEIKRKMEMYAYVNSTKEYTTDKTNLCVFSRLKYLLWALFFSLLSLLAWPGSSFKFRPRTLDVGLVAWPPKLHPLDPSSSLPRKTNRALRRRRRRRTDILKDFCPTDLWQKRGRNSSLLFSSSVIDCRGGLFFFPFPVPS